MSSDIGSPTVPVVVPAASVPVALPLPGTGRQAAAPAPASAPAPHVAGTGHGEDVLNRAAQRVVDSLTGGNSFAFQVDRQTGMTIVKVFNKVTGELVRQIPTEEVVRIAQILRQEEHQPVLDVMA
jgi:flagellar protein FlaG